MDVGNLVVDTNDAFIEMIEVLMNAIIYARDLYPKGIFVKRQMYGTFIHQAVYPTLQAYIGNVLNCARELLKSKSLYAVELQLYENEKQIVENYVFELKRETQFDWNDDDERMDFQNHNQDQDQQQEHYNAIIKTIDDEYLIEYEEIVRHILLNLDEKMKQLKALSNNVKFRINLQTTQSAFIKFTNNNIEFSMVQEAINIPHRNASTTKMLPIINNRKIGLNLYIN